MKHKQINIPIYDGKLDVYIGDYRDLPKKIKKAARGSTNCCMMKGMDVVIILEKNPTLDFLVHECFHFTSFVLDRKGVKADHNNDEAQAYLLDWAVRKVNNFNKKK